MSALPPRWTPNPVARQAGDTATVPAYYQPAVVGVGEAAQRPPTAYTTALYQTILGANPWLTPLGTRRASARQHTVGQRRDVHEDGRAFDLGVPRSRMADGDALADFLVTHAEMLGLNGMVWRGTQWYAGSGNRWRARATADDHDDHLHVEVYPAASQWPSAEAAQRYAAAMAAGESSGGVSSGAVAGIVVGVGAGAAAFLAWALARRRRGGG